MPCVFNSHCNFFLMLRAKTASGPWHDLSPFAQKAAKFCWVKKRGLLFAFAEIAFSLSNPLDSSSWFFSFRHRIRMGCRPELPLRRFLPREEIFLHRLPVVHP